MMTAFWSQLSSRIQDDGREVLEISFDELRGKNDRILS